MSKIVVKGVGFKNADSPFTELFALLQRQEIMEVIARENTNEIINQHINNATEILLQGLQALGHLIGGFQNEECLPVGLISLSFFIALVSNLVEALNAMQQDILR